MYTILDICFGESKFIDRKEFKRITREVTSDMVLSVLSLIRERFPCSENFWRYKRNYEIHLQQNCEDGEVAGDETEQPQIMAQSHMSFLRNLTLYNNGKNKFKPPTSPRAPLLASEQHPAVDQDDSDSESMMDVDEDMEVVMPKDNYNLNDIKEVGKERLIPSTVIGQSHINIKDANCKAPIRMCMCGLPCSPQAQSCE